MRPESLEEYVGQTHILGPGKLLRRAIEADRISSLILFGPPGTGKTTLAKVIAGATRSKFESLSGVESNVADIRRVVVWLGGDFLSGHIHDDTAELAQLAPLAATRWAGERIRGFLDAVAGQADEVIVATNSGNHGRSTDKLRIGTEMEHSFEQHLYLTLAAAETKPNVRWHVGTGYLNVLDLDGFRVRFHHGHAVKFQGGIGGIHVPLNKSIAAWDATLRADLTCLGHWHQFSWGRSGRYVSNGSVIGHSAYAVRIKANYEPPCQACVVIDHERHEATKAFPLFCDRDLRKK
jgi:energy-coupling factor transporter ATP-binding protein EcfA2